MPPTTNILFITLDQWRGDCLGIAGHPVVQTPTLDRLGTEGVWFKNHYAQAAPCGPSRASIHTGTYLHTHRSVFNGTPLADRFTNVARHFRGAGYDPTLFGYTDTTLDPTTLAPGDPRATTYEEMLPGFSEGSYPGELALPWLNWLSSQGVDITGGQWEVRRSVDDYHGAEGRGSTFAPPRHRADQSEAAFLTGLMLEHIASEDDGWFVHGSFLAPHPPFAACEPYNSLIDPADVPTPRRHASVEQEGQTHPFVALALGLMASPEDELEQRQTQATYYGMMAEIDAQLQRLLSELDRVGKLDNTVVIITSDHGEMMGDHWLTQKLGFFDESYHVPLIVWQKGGFDGGAVEKFTESIDIFPTVCDLAGLDIPAQCQGESLTAFLDGSEPETWRSSVRWEFDFRGVVGGRSGAASLGLNLEQCCLAVIRDAAGKYVHFGGLEPVYFDLVEDPSELHNRATDPACRAAVLEYTQMMLDWRLTSIDQTVANQLVGPQGLVDLRVM